MAHKARIEAAVSLMRAFIFWPPIFGQERFLAGRHLDGRGVTLNPRLRHGFC
jgi:hypothetical protein